MKEIKLPRKNLNNPQIKEYVEAIKRGEKSLHIKTSSEGWTVMNEGNQNPTIFPKKEDAVEYAREIAQKSHGSIFVYSSDGRIAEREDYGM